MRIKDYFHFLNRRIAWLEGKVEQARTDGDTERLNFYNGELLTMKWALAICQDHVNKEATGGRIR